MRSMFCLPKTYTIDADSETGQVCVAFSAEVKAA